MRNKGCWPSRRFEGNAEGTPVYWTCQGSMMTGSAPACQEEGGQVTFEIQDSSDIYAKL